MIENKETKGYSIKRINEPMSREELEKIASSIQSEEDCIKYHMSQLESFDKNDKAVIILDKEEDEKCYKELKKAEAKEYFEYLLDSGRVNSKPKEVTRMGYSESSKIEFDEMVKQEKEETKYINEFTMPGFDEVWDNIYVNTYNGDIYNETPDQLPDELREGVGVIIPGIIDKEEDYFDFVKKLKDRGKDGLGRTIYDKYEDYIEATEIIGTYIQAVYDKYGGKEEFYRARDMGGLFGGYEYIPTVKPRYKKTRRNLRMAAGEISDDRFNVIIPDLGARIWEENYGSGKEEYNNEDVDEVVYDDLGARIWEERQEMERQEMVDEYGEQYVEEYYDNHYDDDEDYEYDDYSWYYNDYEEYDVIYDDEDDYYEDDDEIIIIDDVPDEFYSTEIYKQISNFRSNEELIKKLLVSKDVDDVRAAKRMIAEIEDEELLNQEIYHSEFVDILGRDAETLPIDTVINQYAYDKKLYEEGVDAADEMAASNPEIQNAYKNMMKNRAEAIYDWHPEYNIVDIEDYAEYETRYMYDETFKQIEDEKKKISRIGNNVLRKKDPSMTFGESRRTTNSNDNEIQAYIRELSGMVRSALTFLKKNADTDDYTGGYESAFDVGYGSTKSSVDVDDKIDSFELPLDPQGILKYAENNMDLAQRLYEFTVDKENVDDAKIMFSDRCDIDDFVKLASKESKPMITDELMDEIKSRKKRKIELLK